jgi:orotate phosphoribosyltransferase
MSLLQNQEKNDFIELALRYSALRFGEFTLKSGRISPYFFNCGLFNTGKGLAQMGKLYSQALMASQFKFDQLFGPAYKGIPLVCATVTALANNHQLDIPYSFNRKEAKDHGEGGHIVGAPLQGRVLIIDDVITAGTAINESAKIILEQGATVGGVLIALDRQERGTANQSAIEEIKQKYQIPVDYLISVSDLLQYLRDNQNFKGYEQKIVAYQANYGI